MLTNESATGVRPDGSKMDRLIACDWHEHIAHDDTDAAIGWSGSLTPVQQEGDRLRRPSFQR